MSQEEVENLLAEILAIYAPSNAKKSVRWVTRKLPTTSIEEHIPLGSLPYAAVKAAFTRCGMLLKEKPNALAGVILAGSMDMNPAFVAAWTEDQTLHIIAQAKEGLIKQHTAERAIEKFKTALHTPGTSVGKEIEN